jgi:hypothetical protein
MDPRDEYVQRNAPRRGGNVFANQGTGDQIIHTGTPGRRGLGTDSKALLVFLAVDILFFFFGALSYTGGNTDGDMWRAGIFLVLLIVTAGLVRRWLRRRI